MAFEVKVDSQNILKQFGDMQQRINDLDTKLPTVFLDWQREDMNRKFPKIDEQGYLTATTLVYPRSRRVRTEPRARTGAGTKRKQPRRIAGVKRPILRPELVQQLFTRMTAMCREAIEWQ